MAVRYGDSSLRLKTKIENQKQDLWEDGRHVGDFYSGRSKTMMCCGTDDDQQRSWDKRSDDILI
jgi:hypothetical protein